jgi:hypothetical protein
MEDPGDGLDRAAKARGVTQIADDGAHRKVREVRRAGGRPHQDEDFLALVDQHLRKMPAEESTCACYESGHGI